MKYGYTDFELDSNVVSGYYVYIEKSKDEFNQSGQNYYDFIEEHSNEHIVETFFEYDKKEQSGYYNYPIDDDDFIVIKLEKLDSFRLVSELKKIIKYNKKLKSFDSAIISLNEQFDGQITICGNLKTNISIEEEDVHILDKFIRQVRSQNYFYANKYITDKYLSELQILNSITNADSFKASQETKKFLAEVINNIIEKNIKIEKYEYIISKFIENKDKQISEKEWQEYVYRYYRYLFPEYITIEKEYSLDTIDGDKKYVDFLLKSQNSHLLLEIKLPTQQIVSQSKDRNNYYFVASVNKAIMQVNRYYVSHKNKLHSIGRDISTETILLVGWDDERADSDDKVNNDFEMARDMYKYVKIMTYSELLQKLKNILELLKND